MDKSLGRIRAAGRGATTIPSGVPASLRHIPRTRGRESKCSYDRETLGACAQTKKQYTCTRHEACRGGESEKGSSAATTRKTLGANTEKKKQ